MMNSPTLRMETIILTLLSLTLTPHHHVLPHHHILQHPHILLHHLHLQHHQHLTRLPPSWSSQLKRVTIKPFPSTSLVGPTVFISTSPLEIFDLFFSSDLVSILVDESNRYAKQVMGDEKFSEWNPITITDLKDFPS